MNRTPNDMEKQNAGKQPAFWADLILYINLCVILCVMGLAAVNIMYYPEGDVFEHMRAAFMVHNGAVSFRDFFEHHHPLLWFLTTPVVGMLEKNSEIFAVMDYLTYIFFVIGLGFVYLTAVEFISNRTAALMSLIMLLMPTFDMDLINKMYEPSPFVYSQNEKIENFKIVRTEFEYSRKLYGLKQEYYTRVCYDNQYDGNWGDYEK